MELGPGIDRDAGYYAFEGARHRFYWPLLGAAEILDAAAVTVEERAGAPAGLTQHVLLGPVLADVILSRGQIPLHANVVGVGSGAIAIVGPPGAGKSTLGAAAVRAGATPWADDLAAIDPSTGIVPFGTGRCKLNPDAMQRLGMDRGIAPPIYAGVAKRSVLLPGAPEQAPDPRPLRAIYRLVDDDVLGIEASPPLVRALGLMRDVFRVEVQQHAVGAQALLDRCAELAERVPVFLARRPRSMERLPAVADGLLAHAAAL